MKNIGNSSIFEKTMAACLESKRSTNKFTNKRNNNRINRTIKESRNRKFESEDIDDSEMSDVKDDIIVVVDPEISADDLDDIGSEAQEIIDNTPDGEIPMTDEYVDDLTYTCPICGNTFFSETEMHDGDECPVCGDYPNGYLLVGTIAETEDAEDFDNDMLDDETDSDFDDTSDNEELAPSIDEESFIKRRTEKKLPKCKSYFLDESTFNPFLNKFITENYRNAKSFTVRSAKLSGKKLSLECVIKFKSGKLSKTTLRCENFVPAKNMTLRMKDDGVFKVESRNKAPFTFNTVMSNNTISCTGLTYNYITRSKKENLRVQVSGKLMKESNTRKTNKNKK